MGDDARRDAGAAVLDVGTATPREAFDRDVRDQLDADIDERDWDGWYCLRTAPFPCPAEGCDFVASFSTAFHRIVVWPRADDFALLEIAGQMQRVGRDPKVAAYERKFGSCIPFDVWRRVGIPGHGYRSYPS